MINEFPILEHESLQKKCDYSFGDQSGVLGCCPNAYMKKANIHNEEFLAKCEELKGDKQYITLYIDNIRLYKRHMAFSDWCHLKPISPTDREWLNTMLDQDLLQLCSKLPDIKFIIFTGFEDTSIEEHMNVPDNVLAIHATNSVVFGGKVHTFPYGLERKLRPDYDHHEIMQRFITDSRTATKTLYVNCREDTGDRRSIYSTFSGKRWATVSGRVDYETYLNDFKSHKFILCPSGNGVDTIRNWETLYMRRVPVMERHPYLIDVLSGFPVLFVDSFSEVSEDLLSRNNDLYEDALNIDFNMLNLDKIFHNKTEIFQYKYK